MKHKLVTSGIIFIVYLFVATLCIKTEIVMTDLGINIKHIDDICSSCFFCLLFIVSLICFSISRMLSKVLNEWGMGGEWVEKWVFGGVGAVSDGCAAGAPGGIGVMDAVHAG